MTPDRQPADRDQIRAAVAARYGGLARAAQAAESVTGVIISNWVVNLSTDLPAVFAECFRVPRPGGRLGISGISITATHRAGDGVHAAVIRATRP